MKYVLEWNVSQQPLKHVLENKMTTYDLNFAGEQIPSQVSHFGYLLVNFQELNLS